LVFLNGNQCTVALEKNDYVRKRKGEFLFLKIVNTEAEANVLIKYVGLSIF
jgi:hypothetical protein